MSTLMFYSKPVALDKKKHLNFKIKRQDNYNFAAKANSLPVAGFEFFEASRNFPIFFVKNSAAGYIPIAILSFRKDGHDLGENWQGVYAPAYIRRYPFVLSSEGLVLFDEDAPHVQEAEGDALFNAEGEATETTNELVGFLKTVDTGFRLTEEFTKALAEKDIVEPFKGQIKVEGGALNLGDLYAINEKKMHEALSESDVNEWFKKGWLAWAHAHLHSIGSIGEIIKRAQDANSKVADVKKESAE